MTAFHLARQFDDPDEAASAIPGRNVDLSVIGPPSGKWSMSELALGAGYRLLWGRTASAFSSCGAVERQAVLAFWAMDESEAGWTVNGERVGSESLLLLGSGARYAALATRPLEWAALLAPAEALEHLAGETCVARNPAAMPRVRELTRVALRLASSRERDAAELAIASLAAQLERLMAAHPDRHDEPRKPAFHKLMELLQARRAEPLHAGELARMAGRNERALRRDFAAHFGISVGRYLRLRRMNDVRRDLLAGEGSDASVTRAAIKQGFYDLGRFAAQYRRIFGEYPSATLSRSRATARVARRAGKRPTPIKSNR